MKKCLYLVLAFLVGITVVTAGDTILNAWGSLSYGWLNADTFGIQYRGSEQVRQIEQDWPDFAFFITADARRLEDNVHAWQIRKSAQGDVLLVIPNDFTAAKSYKIGPPAQEQEGDEKLSVSEFNLPIPKVLDSQKIIAVGDPITIHLSWDSEHFLFAFTIPAPPDTFEAP